MATVTVQLQAKSIDLVNHKRSRTSSSLDTFKNTLDRFWGNQDIKYDYTAELTGAGSRSEFY